ncbi:MAG: sulfite exporter TauE/SafE family protein [Calditrichia bacterium]
MDYLIISLVALLVAGLTFFSGFGLGTLLMPAFAIFFPVEVAIAATAIVHLLNNLFKVALVGRHAHMKTVLLFGIPAVALAFAGAWLLNYFTALQPLAEFYYSGIQFVITPVKLVIALLMIVFAVFELLPSMRDLKISYRYIPAGGALSGFFGGLSGHQGALRTAFLMRAGLSKMQLIGTMVVCSVLVDVARLLVYGLTFFERDFGMMQQQGGFGLVVAGSLAAFIGSFFGSHLLHKITLKHLRLLIAAMLLLIALALGSGLI